MRELTVQGELRGNAWPQKKECNESECSRRRLQRSKTWGRNFSDCCAGCCAVARLDLAALRHGPGCAQRTHQLAPSQLAGNRHTRSSLPALGGNQLQFHRLEGTGSERGAQRR